MKIALFTDTFLPSINGVVTSVVNSSRKLAKKGHQVMIFTSCPKSGRKVKFDKNIKVKYFRQMRVFNYQDFGLTVPNPIIFSYIRKFRPDLIHSHMPTPLGWEAVLLSRMMKIPLIGTYHTLLPDFLEHLPLPQKFNRSEFAKKLAWNYTRKYYNRCHLVITPSLAMKNLLKKHGIKKPVKVISNGVDLNKFRLKKLKKNGRTVLYVGRVSYEKRIDVVIKAFKLVLKKLPKAKLVIVGGGPDFQKLKKEAGSLLNQSIFFKGPVNHEKLVDIYLKADIFATASTIETEGLVVLEAMACGMPVVGVNALAVPDIVRHRENGLIAKPGSLNQFSACLIELLKNKKLRSAMGKISAQRVKIFSLDKSISELEKTYKMIARKRR